MPNYEYPGTSTVKNRLGATTHEELENLEARYVAARGYQIEIGEGPKGEFDTAHIKAIHQYLFQDVYEWAGHSRDEKVQLSDGTLASEPLMSKMDGRPFMAGPLISKALDAIGADLRDSNYLRDLPREEFASRAADIMAAINAAHPFREGNGRTQRVFISELAKQAGHELNFTVVSHERMIQASIAANETGDPSMMRRLFDEISTPSRVAALTPAISFFNKQGFAWNDRYLATMEPGYPVDITLVGVAGNNFMAHTGSDILIGQAADLPMPRPERGEALHIEPSSWPQPEGRAMPALMAEHDQQPADPRIANEEMQLTTEQAKRAEAESAKLEKQLRDASPERQQQERENAQAAREKREAQERQDLAMRQRDREQRERDRAITQARGEDGREH